MYGTHSRKSDGRVLLMMFLIPVSLITGITLPVVVIIMVTELWTGMCF